MRPRRAFRLGLVFTAASSVFSLQAHADFCARLPVWAEAGCRVVESALWGRTGIGTDEARPQGRLEAAPLEDGPAMDPFGRAQPAANPPPDQQTNTEAEGSPD